LERCLGRRARVGWFLDNYGFTPQLPQLLHQAGMDQVEICLWWTPAYMAQHIRHSEFWWEAPDGTRVLTHVAMPNYNGPRLPGARSYWDAAAPFDPGAEQDLANTALSDFYEQAKRWSAGGSVLIHVGSDFARPNPRLPRYVAGWNEAHGDKALLATPSEFFSAVAAEGLDLPVYRGEISPPMHTEVRALDDIRHMAELGGNVRPEGLGRFGEGYGEAKSERKQLDRIFSNRVRTAEKAAVIASWLGGDYCPAQFEALYRPVMIYQHHDPFIGCCVSEDFDRVMATLRDGICTCEATTAGAIGNIGGRVESQGEGRPYLVLNPLSWQRRDVVALEATFAPGEAADVAVTDDAGTEVPSQLADVERHHDGSIRDATLLIEAEVPSVGHRVHYMRPRPQARCGQDAGEAGVLENERYRIELSSTGTVARLYDKTLQQAVVAPEAAEIVLEEDLGCFCHIDTTGRTWSQSLYPMARVEVVERGPVRWRARIANEFKGCSYREEISIYAGNARIDFDLSMDIRSGEDLRARVRFPLAHAADAAWAEAPYGAVRRGCELGHAINWVDVPQPYGGLGLLNEGLATYELTDEALYLSLWRGLSMLHDSGSCLHRDQLRPLLESGRRRFRFALYPHAGDWRQAGLVRQGLQLNQALEAAAIGRHPGAVAGSHSWFAVSPTSVVLNAVKGTEDGDGLALRLYECDGAEAQATLTLPEGWATYREANLIEEGGETRPITGGQIACAFRPFEVKTIVVGR
ncbi:MAG: glycoside hydrolase family 38 N-terminal domain-containing protein, partial [Anaerolineae bacterium]